MKKITLFGEEIEYSVRHSNRAKIPRIDVSLTEVRVVIPNDSDKDPEEFLEEKALQVIKRKKKFEGYKEKIPNRKFQEGEKFPYLGEDHKIVISDTDQNVVKCGKIILSSKKVEMSSIKKQLKELYKKEAKKIIEKKLEKYMILDFEFNNVKFKNQKTRWASCSSKKNLNFNWRLVMAPEEIIDYVVVHELAHLDYNDHSKRFWMEVSSILPDYKKRAEWLIENSPFLVFSDEDY